MPKRQSRPRGRHSPLLSIGELDLSKNAMSGAVLAQESREYLKYRRMKLNEGERRINNGEMECE